MANYTYIAGVKIKLGPFASSETPPRAEPGVVTYCRVNGMVVGNQPRTYEDVSLEMLHTYFWDNLYLDFNEVFETIPMSGFLRTLERCVLSKEPVSPFAEIGVYATVTPSPQTKPVSPLLRFLLQQPYESMVRQIFHLEPEPVGVLITDPDVLAWMDAGVETTAIKLYKERTGASLKEALAAYLATSTGVRQVKDIQSSELPIKRVQLYLEAVKARFVREAEPIVLEKIHAKLQRAVGRVVVL